MNRCDILIPVFFFYGRDIEALIPLKYFLENRYGLVVKFCSVFDPYMVDIEKPKMVLMENTVGSTFHVDFARYVKKKNIPLISLVSEGTAQSDFIDDIVWGYNRRHEIFFDKMYFWTPSFKRLVSRKIPNLTDRVDFSGGMGFDRYQIYQFAKRKDLLSKYKKGSYTRVIGYAGFVFSIFFRAEDTKRLIKSLGKKTYNQIRDERYLVSDILLDTIKNNQDVLFILKQHPGESSSEMEIKQQWAREFPNVLYFFEEEPLADLINICDIWINYISTTCLEAWLLKKPTITITPKPGFKFRNLFYKGGVCVRNTNELSSCLNEYYQSGKINEFDKREDERKRLIKSFIYSDDGLNAWRTAEKIYLFFLELPVHQFKRTFISKLRYFLQHCLLKILLKLRNLPPVNKSVIIRWYNESPKTQELEKKYRPLLRKFSSERKLFST